jgi:dTDP-4-dehydrorhamnose 3,5-epimerase
MTFSKNAIEGLIEIFPRVFHDERGYFLETYKENIFKENGILEDFVQDNLSFSVKDVVRGLHFQRPPFAQGKLVKVVSGKVLDVAVDVRPNSPTFGQHYSVVLDAIRHNMLYIPAGFAHGFSVIEDAVFSYKCTNPYDKASEGGLLWNCPEINIDWKVENPIVSEKDFIYDVFSKTDFESFAI